MVLRDMTPSQVNINHRGPEVIMPHEFLQDPERSRLSYNTQLRTCASRGADPISVQ